MSLLAMFQAFTISWAVHTLLILIVALIIFAILYAVIGKLPIQDPAIKNWAYLALYLLFALVIIYWLLTLLGVRL